MSPFRTALLFLATVSACDTAPVTVDPDAGLGGGGGGELMWSSDSCEAACTSAASRCGAPSSIAEPACTRSCARGASDSQFECLNSSSCEQLAQEFQRGEAVCGLGTHARPDAGSTPRPDAAVSIPDAGIATPDAGPTCSQPTTCEGTSRVICEVVNGIRVQTREGCAHGCQAGECLPPPSEVAVTGRFAGTVTPVRSGIHVLVSFRANVTQSPNLGDWAVNGPDLRNIMPTFTSPDTSCDLASKILGWPSVTGGGSVDISFNPVSDPTCVSAYESIARNGVSFSYANVPYGGGRTTFSFAIRP